MYRLIVPILADTAEQEVRETTTQPMLGMLVFPDLGEGMSLLWRWELVVSDRASVSCYRPSIQSRKASVAVLPQF